MDNCVDEQLNERLFSLTKSNRLRDSYMEYMTRGKVKVASMKYLILL